MISPSSLTNISSLCSRLDHQCRSGRGIAAEAPRKCPFPLQAVENLVDVLIVYKKGPIIYIERRRIRVDENAAYAAHAAKYQDYYWLKIIFFWEFNCYAA